MKRLVPITLIIAGCLPAHRSAASETVRIEDAVLVLIEDADLPAREPGPLAELSVREGDVVDTGGRLAAIESAEAAIAVTKAESELASAKRGYLENQKVEFDAEQGPKGMQAANIRPL